MIRIVMFSTDKWTSMHGDEGIVLSGKEHVISAPLHTCGKRYMEIFMYSYADNMERGTWKFPCTLTRHITRRGT